MTTHPSLQLSRPSQRPTRLTSTTWLPLSGVAKDSTNLGTFTGSTIADSQTIKAALQALETAVEASGSAATLTAVSADVTI